MIAEALEPLAVNISLPQEHPRNPKKGDVDAIKDSLEMFGQIRPILIQKGTWNIVAGNHTFKAAKALGWDKIAAVQVEMTDEEALQYLLADNRLADLGDYDNAMLVEILGPLAEAGKLRGTGFDEHAFQMLRESEQIEGLLHEAEVELIDNLVEHPRNYREHTEEQLAHLSHSLTTKGFYRNVVIANDGTILAGHGMVMAARMAGMTAVPVTRMPFGPEDEQAIQILAGDNELARQAAVDDRALTEMLKDLAEGLGLEGTGFDEAMLANLTFITRTEGEVKDVNAAAEWVGMPDFDPVVLKPKLMLTFETHEEREAMIEQLGLIISKRERRVVSSWYPPKEREDIESVRWEPDGSAPITNSASPEPGEPPSAEVPEERPVPEVQEPAVPEVPDEPTPTPAHSDPEKSDPVPAPTPELSPNHPASGNLSAEEFDESGYDGPMLPQDKEADRAIQEAMRMEAEQQEKAAGRETAPKQEDEQPDRTLAQAASAARAPDRPEDHVWYVAVPAENLLRYTHEGCDGDRSRYEIPLDDIPLPLKKADEECLNCAQVRPLFQGAPEKAEVAS